MKVDYLFLCILFLGCASEPIDLKRKEMPFEKYDFSRQMYADSDLEYLMGNAEMGGLADTKGLGFEKLWFTDVWESDIARRSISGPEFYSEQLDGRVFSKAEFQNRLSLKDGVFTTSVRFADGFGYETTQFFSGFNKHLLVMHIKNLAQREVDWTVSLPDEDFNVSVIDNTIIQGMSENPEDYTRLCWNARTSNMLSMDKGTCSFSLKPNESQLLLFALTTHFDGSDFVAKANKAIVEPQDIAELVNLQEQIWDTHWKSVASIILPEGDYAKWFYRCLSGIYATAGADHFLPGELQFAIPDVDWKMHHFTYGHGGWPIWVFAQMGDKQRTMNMINWHYKPEALRKNVKIIFLKPGPVELVYKKEEKGVHTYLEDDNNEALAFGHEVSTEGYNITYPNNQHWDMQQHIQGFIGATFHMVNRYYPNESFEKEIAYPVIKGLAELWSGLVKWDEVNQYYYLPPLLSVSENILEKSVLDAVLAARWNLYMAARYAKRLHIDEQLGDEWEHIYKNLYIPQDDQIYLEFLGDRQDRPGGGYFGIRAFHYFGWPLMESMKDLDSEKARASLDKAWQRNNDGSGMITFIMNWFALTESYLGYPEKAYQISKLSTSAVDQSNTAMCEYLNKIGSEELCVNPYFQTGYDSFVLAALSMFVQSYDSTISIFPSIPNDIKDAAFYDLVVDGGFKVSAELDDGELRKARITKNSKHYWSSDKERKVKISSINGKTVLTSVEK